MTAPLVDTDYVAEYSGIEYELQVTLTGGVNGVAPGTVSTTPQVPDFWFEPGTDLQVSAQAQTGFSFLDWTGDLAGLPNPASMTMDGARIGGADFEVIYATADVQVALTATVREDLQLEAENGSDPVTWVLVDGALPEGVALASSGSLWGAAVELGTFPVTVEATDALGLTATATVTLDVGPPAFPIGQLASTFLLGGPPLSAVQLNFLDRQGNGDGVYDLGDFRAWVLANPSLPLSADLADAREPRILVLPMRLERPGEAR